MCFVVFMQYRFLNSFSEVEGYIILGHVNIVFYIFVITDLSEILCRGKH